MNTWIKRSLGTTAVAGGLLLAGAAIASADESHQANDSSTGSAFSSPVNIGGFDAGVTSERSSKNTSTETGTDRGGDTTSQSRSSQDASKDTLGLSSKGISLDPAGSVRQAQKNASSSNDTGGDSNSGSNSSSTDVAGQSPVRIGGLTGTAKSARSAKDSSKDSRTDENGTRTSERSSESASKTGGTLGTGDITADPAGSLRDARADGSSSQDSGFDRVTRQSASDSQGDLRSPVSLGGATAAFADERASQDARKDTVRDQDGYRSESGRNASASRTQGGLAVGSLTADPTGTFRDQRDDSSASGDPGDRRDNASASDSTLGLSAPFRGEGISGGASREDSAANDRESVVSDEDGTVRRTESQQSASRNAVGGASGAFGGNPTLGLRDVRDAQSTRGDQVGRDDSTDSSNSDTASSYGFPYYYDGFAFGGDFASTNARQLSKQVSDENGTTTRTESTEDSQRTTPVYSFDGFNGSPEGDFSTQRMLDELSQN